MLAQPEVPVLQSCSIQSEKHKMGHEPTMTCGGSVFLPIGCRTLGSLAPDVVFLTVQTGLTLDTEVVPLVQASRQLSCGVPLCDVR